MHLTGKKQDPEFVKRRTAHMVKGMVSLNPDGSKPCVPGCECPRHERHWEKRKNKLTPVRVREIRAICAQGADRGDVAEEFGIARNTVCNIVNRKAWAHVV
jgi:hypothetical protein